MGQFMGFSGDYQGLSTEEAEERIGMYGYNIEHHSEDERAHFKPARVFLSLRFVLMLAAAVLLILGEQTAEGLITLLLLVAYVALELVKGVKCDQALHGLQRTTAMKFRVIREGEILLIRKRGLVPDDIIILQSGENVPADAHLLEVENLTVDESLFTSDKTPVVKLTGADTKHELKRTCVYKGSRVLTGSLVGRVVATGVDTKKCKTLSASPPANTYYTSFETAIGRVTPVFSALAFVLLAVVSLFSFIGGMSDTLLGLVTSSLLPGVSFALCFIPASTASIVRLYYITGGVRIAKKYGIVKDLAALESLNALTAICVDKAGVITKNRIEVAEEHSPSPEMLANVAILSCDTTPSSPYDQAIIHNAAFKHIDIKELHQNELISRYLYTEKTKIDGNLWRINGARLMCIKGTPESVFTVCDMDADQLFAMQKKQQQYAKQGLQVIAVGYARLAEDQLIPDSVYDIQYSLVGMLAFTNQTKDSIPVAVRNCYRAGVRVIMMTGDSEDTALAIGKKIGLRSGRAVTGEELDHALEHHSRLELDGVNIFAGISSDHRCEIVRQLQAVGDIVAITGDTASDAEVLMLADVGISKVQNSSGASQEAGDILMNDDNFNNIVETFKEARQLHRNIKRAVSMSISATIAVMLFAVVNLLLPGGFLLSPVMMSLVMVVFVPACMLHFLDNASDMKNPLSPSGFIARGRISRRYFVMSGLQGLALFAGFLLQFLLMPDAPAEMLRACLMTTLVAGLVTMAWTGLSEEKKLLGTLTGGKTGYAAFITGAVLLLLLLLINIPGLNAALGLAALNPVVFLTALLVGVLSQIWYDFVKKKENGGSTGSTGVPGAPTDPNSQ